MRIPANRFHAAISLTLILAMLSLTACGGSDSPAGSGGGGTAGIAVNGAAAGPGGVIAKITSPSKSWFASLFQVAEAFAQQVTGWTAIPNATVRVFRIDENGHPIGTTLIPPVTTAADGSFSLTLPTGTVLDSTLVAQVEADAAIDAPVDVGSPNTYSALLVNTTVALNPSVEAVTRAIVNNMEPLANFNNAEVTQVYSAISTFVAQNLPTGGDASVVSDGFSTEIARAITAISGTTAGALVILTSLVNPPPSGLYGINYSEALVAVGGTGTLTWSLEFPPGSLSPLPPDVTLGANGQLTGIPRDIGNFLFTVRVTDAANPAQSATKNLSLGILGNRGGHADIVVTNATPPSGNANFSTDVVTSASSMGTDMGVSAESWFDGTLRKVVVRFETTGGAVQSVNYHWGRSSFFENLVSCTAMGCSGVSVNQTTKNITFANTVLVNHNPSTSTSMFATLNGAIQYP